MLFVLVPFCYLAGAFAVAPVVERANQAAHIQLLSGCPAPLYWAGSYVRMRSCLTLQQYIFLRWQLLDACGSL